MALFLSFYAALLFVVTQNDAKWFVVSSATFFSAAWAAVAVSSKKGVSRDE